MFGGKNIENRTWSTAYRGPLAIHSSKTVLAADIAECERSSAARLNAMT